MPNIFDEYAIVVAQMEALEKKKDEMRPKIIEEMVSKGMKKLDTAVGTFSVVKLKKWTYPQEVLDINEAFKAAKAKAESTKEATYEEVDSMKFIITKL